MLKRIELFFVMMVAIQNSYFMLDGVRFARGKGDFPHKCSVGLEKFSAVVAPRSAIPAVTELLFVCSRLSCQLEGYSIMNST